MWRWTGTPAHLEQMNVISDGNGWYPILPFPATPDEQWMPANLLLNWPTKDPGLYKVVMEFAEAGPTLITGSQTTPIGINVDNTAPTTLITEIHWRVKGEAVWQAMPRVCAIIGRPSGKALEFKVTYTVSALHLRDTVLYGNGCGAGILARRTASGVTPSYWSDPPTPAVDGSGVSLNPYEHWHINELDNNIIRSAIFDLDAGALQGAYDFSLWGYSRSFNPAGGDGGYGPADWFYDNPYSIYGYDYWKFAVVDV